MRFIDDRLEVYSLLENISPYLASDAIKLIDSFNRENQTFFIYSLQAMLSGYTDHFIWVIKKQESINELTISYELMQLFDGYFLITNEDELCDHNETARWSIALIKE